MHIAAHDVGRLSRLAAGCAGVAVAAVGSLSATPRVPPGPSPAAALVPAGVALLLQALPAGRISRALALLLALVAAGVGALAFDNHPAAAAATVLAGLGLAGLDLRVARTRFRLADPLVAGAAIIALVTLVPRMFDPTFPAGRGPGGGMAPAAAGALLALALGTVLARPETGPLRIAETTAVEPPAPPAYVATYVDIADRKRAEVSLGAQNTELREANARLEAALAFKNDLTSMLTHDVAQPLSSIASLAELLRADWADLPEDIRLELATKIDKNTQRLIKMMNDLHLLFRLDTGSITARQAPVPLFEVASVVQEDVELDLELDIAEELAVLADRGHLTVVLQNLVRNAVAYGAPPVLLSARRRADLVEIMVQDRGPGIPEELVPSLFGRFVRGAGLGLFIVRHLVEANGGSVRYERAEPRGARLIVELEAAPI